MKVLVVGAIHGRVNILNEAFNKYLSQKYDKIIFTGDIADGYESDEKVLRCFNVLNAMIKSYPDKVIALIGNHDEPYFRYNPEKYRNSSGYRPNLHYDLHAMLNPMKRHYQYAFGIKKYLFTHAGIQYSWLSKHFDVLNKWAELMRLDITDPENLWLIVDGVARTSDGHIIHEIGPKRGGADSDIGGPLWCDMEEMINRGPYPGLNQVCGHTKTDNIYRFHKFEGTKFYKNTSVTYVDVLSNKTQFLTLNIDD